MKFCEYCGSQIAESAKFCTHCGAKQEPIPQPSVQSEPPVQTTPIQEQTSQQANYQAPQSYTQTAQPKTNTYARGGAVPIEAEPKKGMAALAYISWLIIIPLIVARNNDFVRFHLNQALNLFLGSMLLSVLSNLLSGLVEVLGILSLLLSLVLIVINLVIFVFGVMGLINALQGKKKALPLISGINLLK
ncbi:MAG: zinc-ribbon domain-containing protein [Ruminococcaceae bacterium]|nr:zinc-ribbon domain-containing protein [Oscillospiraceae bacterium]